ncbi:MAG TPA: L-2-hydroxyglutarate oxidase [Longimicrobiales bacterium]
MRFDVAVIGGGIVGLATARALVTEQGVEGVCVLEKESALAQHQSTHNSDVLHAGLQYQPGSEKARLAREGIRRMTEYCRHHDLPHEICGKLVVAVDQAELPRLEDMLDRGRQNGLQGLRRLGAEEVREIEPHVRCAAAIHVPEEGIVSFRRVCGRLATDAAEGGVEIHTDARVRHLARENGAWTISTTAGDHAARVLVNCAGLHTDRVARMAGERPAARTLPFRGEYQRLRADREHLVRHLVYPLPEPGFPFLGVHFTRRIEGGVDAGPSAVLAFAREGYRLGTVNPRDLVEALTFVGLWRFAARHRRMVGRELARSFDRRRFVDALRRLVPEITAGDLVPGGSGVRAQAVLPSGELVHDFLWIERPGAVHVLNAPSPAATASLAIGSEIARRARKALEA